MAGKLELLYKIDKDIWCYKGNEELLDPHMGKYFISYSQVSAVLSDKYFYGFLKQKFVRIKDEPTVYNSAGNFIGSYIETGELPKENPFNITLGKDFDVNNFRDKGAEYEKLIILPITDNIVLLGFADKVTPNEDDTVSVTDFKTGSVDKKKEYLSEDYVQLVLYRKALELQGYKVRDIKVTFMVREGSHLKDYFTITGEYEDLPLEYNEERVNFAIDKVKKACEKISKYNKAWKKIVK